jgi:isopentenyl diphosphate isomerase/L-lactate dehydrogenase-like FMN-dependent dehydrogenase
MAHKVFISASHKDRDLARDLVHRLRNAGVPVVYSELTLSAGSGFEKDFMELLRSTDEIMVILSSNSVENLWMMYEIGAASSLRKKITPVVVGLEDNEIPSVIKQLKHIRYDAISDYISKLERTAQAA